MELIRFFVSIIVVLFILLLGGIIKYGFLSIYGAGILLVLVGVFGIYKLHLRINPKKLKSRIRLPPIPEHKRYRKHK